MATIKISKADDKPIKSLPVQTLAFGDTDTTKNFTISGNGKVHTLIVELPNFTNDVTATVTVTDQNSYDIYAKASLAKNDKHVITGASGYIYLDGVSTVTITLSGQPGGTGGNVKVKIAVE